MSTKQEEQADVRPWEQEAKKFSQWHEDSVEDCFGRYPFAKYPCVFKRTSSVFSIHESIDKSN